MSIMHFQSAVGVAGAQEYELVSGNIVTTNWGFRSADSPAGSQVGTLAPVTFKGYGIWLVQTGQGGGNYVMEIEGIRPAGFWTKASFDNGGATGVPFEVLEGDCVRLELTTYTRWTVATGGYLQTLGNPWSMVLE